jgi:hypothetical protein
VLRSVGAVIAGYLVFGISAAVLFPATRHDPHAPASTGFMVATTIYGMVFAAAGGYLAARIAGRRPRAHAVAVAAIIALGALVSLIASPGAGSTWSQTAAIFFMAPAAIVGGVVGQSTRKEKTSDIQL